MNRKIKELQDKLAKDLSKATKLANKNTKRNNKCHVLWSKDDD